MNRNRIPLALTLALALLAGSAGPALSAAAPAGFDAAFPHYDAARKALVADSLEGVAEHAAALKKQAPKDTLGKEIAAAAGKLAAAKDLAAAREAFGALSQPMVRWREASGGKGTVVAFCPMINKSWVQPKGEIGNPYYGKSMATCGEVTSK